MAVFKKVFQSLSKKRGENIFDFASFLFLIFGVFLSGFILEFFGDFVIDRIDCWMGRDSLVSLVTLTHK